MNLVYSKSWQLRLCERTDPRPCATLRNMQFVPHVRSTDLPFSATAWTCNEGPYASIVFPGSHNTIRLPLLQLLRGFLSDWGFLFVCVCVCVCVCVFFLSFSICVRVVHGGSIRRVNKLADTHPSCRVPSLQGPVSIPLLCRKFPMKRQFIIKLYALNNHQQQS